MNKRLAPCIAALAALFLFGCGERPQPAAPEVPSPDPVAEAPSPGGVMFDIEGDDVFKVVLEAEEGEIEAPMGIYGDATPPPGEEGPTGASGGRYVETPEVDPETGQKVERNEGSTTLAFTVPETGNYYVWLRVWWRHSCANSFSVVMEGMGPHIVSDNTVGTWRWLAVGPSVFRPAPIRLEAGEHAIQVFTREDGSVLDQVLIVDDPEYAPTGIEKAD